jgi:hypothetical protein
MLKYSFTFYALLFSYYIPLAQVKGIRFGGGVGYSLYTGNQMDQKISFSTKGKSELNLGSTLQLHFAINDKYELGIKYLTTNLWSFKSKDIYGLHAEIDELGIILQRSLNDNIKINDGRFTFNVFAGVGACQFKSAFYDFSVPYTSSNFPITSIGYGSQPTTSGISLPNKLIQPILIGGISVGVRINNFTTIYFENSFSTTNSNKISGNLYRKNAIPPDGYTFHAITVYLNYYKSNRPSRIRCPKF